MLDTVEEIQEFIDFRNAGGIQPPETLTIGRQVNSAAAALSGKLSALIVEDVDYNDVQSLVNAINTLASESQQAVSATERWNVYLEETAIPTALEIPSQGHDVLCKVNGIDNNKSAPFIGPIISKSEIQDLQSAVANVDSETDSTVALMAEINAILDTEVPGAGLSQDLINRANEEATKLQISIGLIGRAFTSVESLLNSAIQNKAESEAAFYQAVDFTIANSQLSDPAIKEAAEEIYPDI